MTHRVHLVQALGGLLVESRGLPAEVHARAEVHQPRHGALDIEKSEKSKDVCNFSTRVESGVQIANQAGELFADLREAARALGVQQNTDTDLQKLAGITSSRGCLMLTASERSSSSSPANATAVPVISRGRDLQGVRQRDHQGAAAQGALA